MVGDKLNIKQGLALLRHNLHQIKLRLLKMQCKNKPAKLA